MFIHIIKHFKIAFLKIKIIDKMTRNETSLAT